ncbi:MAG: ABC transporter permease subunit [Planctomycetota bacterium]
MSGRGGPFSALAFVTATLQVSWKELKTSFRDRQTTLYTLVLPIVLYPTLFWSMIQVSLFLEGRSEVTAVAIGIAAPDEALLPQGLGEGLERAPGEEPDEDLNRVDALPARAPLDEEVARDWVQGRAEAGGEGEDELPDAVVYVHEDAEGRRDGLRIFYDSTRTDSRIALGRAQRRIPAFASELRARAAKEADPEGGSLEPFLRESARNIAPQPAIGAYLLSSILPILFVLMTVMGAFFPAVDLTCGERERKTAETTLLLPVPRSAVHLGKILAVSVAALIATGLNLAAVALSVEHILRMLPAASKIEVQLPVGAMLRAAPLLLLFGFFVSSVLTGISSLARTFKEGQALLGPVQVLFVLPGLVGSLPGVTLTPFLASIPVVNVVLCFRNLLRGEMGMLEYAVAAVSLAALSVAAIGMSLWMLSRESLHLGGTGSTWSNLRGLLHSPKGSE